MDFCVALAGHPINQGESITFRHGCCAKRLLTQNDLSGLRAMELPDSGRISTIRAGVRTEPRNCKTMIYMEVTDGRKFAAQLSGTHLFDSRQLTDGKGDNAIPNSFDREGEKG